VFIEAIIQFISNSIPVLIDAAVELFMSLLDGLMKAIPIIVDALPKLISSILNSIMAALPLILQAAITLFSGLLDGLIEVIPMIVEMLPTIIDSIVEFVASALPQIIEAGVALFMSLVGLDSTSWQNAFDAFMLAIEQDFAGLRSLRDSEFVQQLTDQQTGWQSQMQTQLIQWNEWFATAKADPANYFQRNFDNPTMYEGCTLWTKRIGGGTTLQEIRVGETANGSLVASREAVRVDAYSKDITYKFYDLTTFALIASFVEHFSKVDNATSKSYVEVIN